MEDIKKKEKEIKLLIDMLKGISNKNIKAMVLQSYIAKNGPVPDEYGDEILKALET